MINDDERRNRLNMLRMVFPDDSGSGNIEHNDPVTIANIVHRLMRGLAPDDLIVMAIPLPLRSAETARELGRSWRGFTEMMQRYNLISEVRRSGKISQFWFTYAAAFEEWTERGESDG
jgi:hypothetical protein